MGRFRMLAVVAVVALALTGCLTGERPSLAPAEAAVTDAAVQAVLTRLETASSTQFTAMYSILTKLTSEPTPTTSATVAQNSGTSWSITIGNVRFLAQDGTDQTCDVTAGTCQSGLNDALVSNLLVSHDFAAAAPAARLRQDAATMVGAATPSTRDVAGQTATCVTVNFAAGSKVYCALDNGLLAFQDTPDLQIDLLSLTAGADSGLFSAAMSTVPTVPTVPIDPTATTATTVTIVTPETTATTVAGG